MYGADMSTKVNPPQPQGGPILFLLVCLVGIAFAGGGIVTLEAGTEPWWAGVLGLGIIVGGGILLIGGWLWIQREVVFSDGAVIVRRWLDVLAGRPGRVIRLGDGTRVSITLENIQSLRIERDGVLEASLTLGYWEPNNVRHLVEALRANRVPFGQHWKGEYPPGT